ncbi:hypothetical protein JCM11491_000045 [Sporobolomyces phaffii]
MTTENLQRSAAPPPPPSLDRFSLLPNELLDAIFALAYSFYPPKAPLSKRLRPFQERELYRSVTIVHLRQFRTLSRTLELDPARGELVTKIAIGSYSRPHDDDSRVSLDDLLSALPNLVTLEIPVGLSPYEAPSGIVLSRLWRVKMVSASIHSCRFGWSDLAFLSMLPNLNDLVIYNWLSFGTRHSPSPNGFSFKHVVRVKVMGEGIDKETVLPIANLCPNLLHLHLFGTDGRGLQHPDLLPLVPATLHSLQLDSPYGSSEPCDLLLPRFSHLRQLNLGETCHSESIHTTLAQLPNLVSIRLGDGQVDYRGFAALVSGPSRLVELKSLIFDTKTAFSPDDMADWVDPSDYLPDPVGLRALRGVCDSNGVDLSGTMFDDCLRALEDFHVEWNNRAVLAAAYHGDRDFDQLHHTRTEASRAGVTLPSFDLDSLDPDHLEVVETELPEKEWIVLSLRNRCPDEQGKIDGRSACTSMEDGAGSG